MALTLLYSESGTTEGCDRLFSDGERVVVQGTHLTDRGEYGSIGVPDGEALVGVSAEAILAAARALEAGRARG